VRESIKKLYKTDKDKDAILDMLNLYGFGECDMRRRKRKGEV